MPAGTHMCGRPPARFPAAEYSRRIKALQRRLSKEGIDGAIISTEASRLYFTGFESTAGTLAVSAAHGAVFAVDFRYAVMAKEEMPFLEVVEGGLESLSSGRRLGRLGRIGFESSDSFGAVERIRQSFGEDVQWERIDGILDSIRSVKSSLERKKLRAAAAAGEALYGWVLERLRPGMTEWEARALFRRGADVFAHGESFGTIACSGANCAKCHHHPSPAPFAENKPYLFDFGVLLDHYRSDMTRSGVFGRPSALYRKVYDIVLEANLRAIEAIRPGKAACEIDAVARDFIASKGYGDDFGHALGHSLGVEIHESPSFSGKCKTVLKPGMAMTVEPGIYLPGKFGIRIEDMVFVTAKGCEVVTSWPKNLGDNLLS